MDNCSFKLKHVAACSNRSPNCYDIGPNNVVAFGCSNSVNIYNIGLNSNSSNHSIYTYNLHKNEVDSIQWLRSFVVGKQGFNKSTYLLSGDSSGSLICWSLEDCVGHSTILRSDSLKSMFVVDSHKGSIRCLDGVHVSDSNNALSLYLIASSGSDSKVKLWYSYDSLLDVTNKMQLIDFGNKFVLGLKFHILPFSSVPFLACACDDFKIRFYLPEKPFKNCSKENLNFIETVVLSGHSDWVRSINFVDCTDGSVLFASTSQDCTVRIWKLFEEKIEKQDKHFLEVKKEKFSVFTDSSKKDYSICIDSILESHEQWVYSAEWNYDSSDISNLQLLTASLDKVIILWEYNINEKIWMDTIKVGEVGGNTLGFYKASFCHNNKSIFALSYSGAFYEWNCDENGRWQAGVVVGGHMSAVRDLDWHPKGHFIISTSEDQTTRIFAKCCYNERFSWHEVARTQIHGYNMHCVALLSDGCHFVSGGDEKVVRVFRAPQNFLKNFSQLTDFDLSDQLADAPQGASVPALGLSNKAVFTQNESIPQSTNPSSRNDQYIDNLFQSLSLQQPPSETDLLQNTLWPEVSKLYGHVYEIFGIAANKSGSLFASSSKSFNAKPSGVFVWKSGTWENVGLLQAHNLTVTQIEFSPDGKFILSVSRDRTWALYSINEVDGKFVFDLVSKSEKKTCHSRIIWSCSWSKNSKHFITGSRDSKLMLWKLDVKSENEVVVDRDLVEKYNEAVTAVAFNQYLKSEVYDDVFAIGFESGQIRICGLVFTESTSLHQIMTFDVNASHCLAVQRLKWKPEINNEEEQCSMSLASCGLDNQLKIFELII